MAQVNALRVVEAEQSQNNTQVLDNTVETKDASVDNVVRRCVEEFCELHKEMHNLRENLIALNVPAQTVTVLVEMGFNDRVNEQEKLMNSCLEEAGGGHIDESVLTRFKTQLHELINLERDMAHARKIARESGLSLPALNALTQMIRQNPGDGGEKVINSFLAYALAVDIPMTQIEDVLKTVSEKKTSVLPVIELDDSDDERKARVALVRDVVLGLIIAATLMLLLT